MAKRPPLLVCSFCGRDERETVIVPGPNGACICDDCARQVTSLVDDVLKAQPHASKKQGKKPPAPPALGPVPAPKEIKAFLDKYVIGHDETKKTLAVAVHNHYRRLEAREAARPEADGESGEGRREGGWRGREARGAGKIRRAAGTAGPAAGLNPPGGLRGPHPFTS